MAAGTKVVGIGPSERVGRAHCVVAHLADLHADALIALLND